MGYHAALLAPPRASPHVLAFTAFSPPRFDRMKIIYIEDSPDVRDMVELLLQSWGHDVQAFDSAEAGSHALQADGVDLLISDLELPGMSGLELMRQVMGRNAHVHGLLLTGHRADMYRPHLPERVHILSKPFDVDDLQQLLTGLATAP